MPKHLVWVPLALALLAACASIPVEQTARTVESGKHEIGASVEYGTWLPHYSRFAGSVEFEVGGPHEPNSSEPESIGMNFSFFYRRGLAEHWDAEARLSIAKALYLGTKYQLVDMASFAAAVGFGVRYLGGLQGISSTGTLNYPSSLSDFMVPVFLSYDIVPWCSAYFSPRYVFRTVYGGFPIQESAHMLVTTLGAKFGKKIGAYAEIEAGGALNHNFKYYAVNAAFFMSLPFR